MIGAPTTCEFFASQAICEERCPMHDEARTPEAISRLIAWAQAPSAPYMNEEGNDTSGVTASEKNAVLRCAHQIMRGACGTPVTIQTGPVKR